MSGTCVAVFSGEYDIAAKQSLRDDLRGVGKEPALVLDFSGVSYIDSSCITELLELHRYRRSQGFEPETIVLAHPVLKRLFDVLDLFRILRCVESLDEALPWNGEAAMVIYMTHGAEDVAV